MDIKNWQDKLGELPLGNIYLYQEVGSTNTEAERLVAEGAPPFSVVLADTQKAGKGRQGRSWVTRPGQALALSWILYPERGRIQAETLGRLSGLGALAVCQTLREGYHLPAQIKWPNDVLVEGKKIAGILVEVHWDACRVLNVILGLGMNVYRQALPQGGEFLFPATTLEDCLDERVPRLDLVIQVLQSLLKWYQRLAEPSLIQAWNDVLAYKNQPVNLASPRGPLAEGIIIGVDEDGSLMLQLESGEIRQYHSGEIQVRLVDRS